jgi:CO/xanthine dehydrogenase Mo-binding subunit
MPESNVRIVVPYLGGGFGGKCDFHFEAHVAALARVTRRPVKLVFTRREEFLATDKVRHPMVMYFKTAVKKDGTITARQARLVLDTGAYAADGPAIGEVATMMAAGPYRIPHLLIEANTVYTNRTPAGSVRAPSGPQVCWALEQHTDVVAERVGMDPVEFRLKNLADEGDEGPTGQRFTAIGTKECLSKAAELAGWKPGGAGNRPGQLAEDEAVGVAVGWWFSYPSPSGAYTRLNSDGSTTVITGAQENGSGAVMGLARLQADVLGLDPRQVSLIYQDTDTGPWDNGSSGSQTTYNAGRAVLAAANQVRERLSEMAGKELEAEPQELEFKEGSVRVKGAPERSITLAALADKAFDDGGLIVAGAAPDAPPLPDNFGASCAGRTGFPAFADPAFFCHAVRVRVDKETGVVSVRDVVAAHDFGRVLNLPGAEGQIEGGIAHGIGIALLEGTQYHDGKQVNPHLLDYKLQTASDAPPMRIVFVEKPAVSGPLGGKGVGEPPVVPTAGAIGNAIAAATGARVRELPMTPYRVWAAMQEPA